jgi:hypothetical protein
MRMKDALSRLGLRDRTIHRTQKNPAFYVYVNDAECWNLYEVLYKGVDASQYLDRKKRVFESFFAEHTRPKMMMAEKIAARDEQCVAAGRKGGAKERSILRESAA